MKKYFLLLSLILPAFGFSQTYYRISGEFSIKGKSENSSQLVMGKFYYDKNEKKIIHDNIFPEKEKWVTADTNMYKIVNGKIESRQTIPNLTEFSIYHMILNNNLDNFGLENSIFKLDKIENENGMVISTWLPPKKLKKAFGKIMISSKNDNLFGIVFFDVQDSIIKKQFFEDYTVIKGLPFPGKIVEIVYSKTGKESYQVTTYKNIAVNDHSEEKYYHFSPSDYK